MPGYTLVYVPAYGDKFGFTRASLDLLTRVSYDVSCGVGACSGRVSVIRVGEIATGLWG
jgi:hypothetical protein